jgi:hypothetical protein
MNVHRTCVGNLTDVNPVKYVVCLGPVSYLRPLLNGFPRLSGFDPMSDNIKCFVKKWH